MNKIIRRHWNLFSVVILFTCLLWIWITSVLSPVTTPGLILAPKSGFLAPAFSLTALDGEVQILEYRGILIWSPKDKQLL